MPVVEYPGSSGNREHAAARRFHFFPPRDEMRPVRAFDQDVRQHGGDQFARRIFIKKRHRVHGRERTGERRAFVLRNQRPRWALHPLHAVIGVQRQNQNVPHRTRLFQQTDVAGMEQIVTAVCEYNSLTGVFPFPACRGQFFSCIKDTHSCAATIIGKDACKA